VTQITRLKLRRIKFLGIIVSLAGGFSIWAAPSILPWYFEWVGLALGVIGGVTAAVISLMEVMEDSSTGKNHG
jgi:hypothetical protein